MKSAALLIAALALASCANGAGRRGVERAPDGQRVLRGYDGEELQRTANPSELVAEDIGFARAVREDGQWTAFRRFAADDAVLFVPSMVRAADWLSGRPDPAAIVQWQPHRVVMACDGRTGVTTGALQQADGSTGYYTTVWQRENKRRAKWEWTLHHTDRTSVALAEPEFVRTQVGECRGGVPTVIDNPTPDPISIEGRSDDRTMVWRATVGADNSRDVSVDLWNGSSYDRVIDNHVVATGTGEGTR